MNRDPFEEYVKRFRVVDPEPCLKDRIFQAVRETVSVEDGRSGSGLLHRLWLNRLASAGKENRIMNIIRRGRSSRIKWAVGVAAVLFAVALVAGLNPWDRPSGSAFANAVEHLRSTRTLTFTLLTQDPGRPLMKIEIAYKAPGYFREDFGDTLVILDPNERRGIMIIPSEKGFWEPDLSEMPADHISSGMEWLTTLPDRPDEVIGEREMDGRIVGGFRVMEHDFDITVWVDTATERLVRVETESMDGSGRRMVMTDFQFDAELDDALFSLTPPEGYRRLEVPAQ